jgi:hypothetical protein
MIEIWLGHIHICHPVYGLLCQQNVLASWGSHAAVGVSRYGPIATVKAVANLMASRLLPWTR